MRDERWAAVWKLFNSAHDLPAGKRLAYWNPRPSIRSFAKRSWTYWKFPYPARLEQSVSPAPAGGPEYPVGYQFDRFMIVGFIGQGGFGRIYAAHDRDLRESWH